MSSTPKIAGVCGWPIHHSLSPLLHNYWLKMMNIKGAYIPFAVREDKALEAFTSLKKTTISGVNVTMPLKSLAFEAADDVTEDARLLGVSNCLYIREGKLVAHNTDMEGFLAPLIAKIEVDDLTHRSVLVIGAGGAAKAVIAALLSFGVSQICLINRTDKKADDIVDHINVPSLYMLPWEDRELAVSRANLIINASAGGMKDKPPVDIDLSHASKGSFIYDLVYTPLMTPLLQDAQKHGHALLGGLDMLIEQARPSFKLFYGQTPSSEFNEKAVLLKALESGAR